jgi:acyl carrier protein
MQKKLFSSNIIKTPLFTLNKFHFGGASHHHPEPDTAPKRFDHVKYMRKLNAQQRKEEGQDVLLFDTLNEPTARFHFRRPVLYIDEAVFHKKEVLLPYESTEDDIDSKILDRSELEARIYNILRQFDFMDLEKFDFAADYEKELGLDSLDWTALLTSIEYEFHTVFNDTFYEHWRCINDVINHLEGDKFLF